MIKIEILDPRTKYDNSVRFICLFRIKGYRLMLRLK